MWVARNLKTYMLLAPCMQILFGCSKMYAVCLSMLQAACYGGWGLNRPSTADSRGLASWLASWLACVLVNVFSKRCMQSAAHQGAFTCGGYTLHAFIFWRTWFCNWDLPFPTAFWIFSYSRYFGVRIFTFLTSSF